MKNTAGEKVKQIIYEEFDGRVAMAVITYILDKGFGNLKEVTDEEILKVKGNALMTDSFCQSLVRAAVRICREVNMIDEFLPYVVNHLYVPNANMKEIEVYKSETSEEEWDCIMSKFDLDYEEDADEIDMITLNANVIEFYKRNEGF